ncbi:hypothetical protein Q1695_007086 [Nippostrongylus brasiliensis]|nr:hypothetical protein Q1695_007086 [Nippostrongylus brasiliensis]
MGKRNEKEIFEFPDSTVNVNVKFKESDLQNLEESDGSSDASHGSKYLYQALAAKFNPTVSVLVSAGFIEILLNGLSSWAPKFAGFITLVFVVFLYEWQRLHASKLTRNCRASFNFSDLLAKDEAYIPYYNMGWLLGPRYKGFVISCTGEDDERTPNEPETCSPPRSPADPKFHR